jgi:zinc/manganese transport system ATP-binding protein
MGGRMTIALQNFSAGYDRHPAIHHLSGAFPAGSLTAVVGPNGGGKSTFLKALIGFLKPMSGAIDYNGIAPEQIAYLPQQSEADRRFPLSVMDVVLLGLWPKIGAFGGVTKAQREDAMRALEQVGMSAFAARPIEALSSGQWRRVLFARLILQDARVLLLDEPFAGIDARTAHELVHILERWQREGRTVITVMHDLEMVREHFGQALMLARELVAWGPTAQVLTEANLARAAVLAGSWVEHPEACARDEGVSAL